MARGTWSGFIADKQVVVSAAKPPGSWRGLGSLPVASLPRGHLTLVTLHVMRQKPWRPHEFCWTTPNYQRNFTNIPLQRSHRPETHVNPTDNRETAQTLQNGERPWRDCGPVRSEPIFCLDAARPRTRVLMHPNPFQLRPAQVQRYQPHHQGRGPRLRADFGRQGRRERPCHHRREPCLRPLRLRPCDGRERRFPEPPGATGWSAQERLERAEALRVLRGGGNHEALS